MNTFYKRLYKFFYRTLCICPDKPRSWRTPIRGWWNHKTACIAWYFHQKYCAICQQERMR